MAYMKITLYTKYVGTDEPFFFEIPDNWSEFTPEAQEDYKDECWQEAVASFAEGSIDILDGDMEEDGDY